MTTNEFIIIGITAHEQGVILNIPFYVTRNVRVLYPFQLDGNVVEEILAEDSPVNLEKRLKKKQKQILDYDYYSIYYSFIVESVENRFKVNNNTQENISSLSPGNSWKEQFEDWYKTQAHDYLLMEAGQKNNYVIATIDDFNCVTIPDVITSVTLKNSPDTEYWYLPTAPEHIHWCVAITHAFRTGEALAFKIDETSNEIVAIRTLRQRQQNELLVKTNITHFIGQEPPSHNYFSKELQISALDDSSRFGVIDLNNPAFYSILEFLLEAFFTEQVFTVYFLSPIREIDELTYSQEECRQHANDYFFYYIKDEFHLYCPWEDYTHLKTQEKIDFWQFLLGNLGSILNDWGYDFYHMFSPKAYAFTFSKEPSIDYYYKQVAEGYGWDLHQIEHNISRELTANKVATIQPPDESDNKINLRPLLVTQENVLLKVFSLKKYPKTRFEFMLMNNPNTYHFIPEYPKSKPWIMKIIHCWREKEPISFRYDEASGEVVELW